MADIQSIHKSHPVRSWLNQAQIEIKQRPERHGVLSEAEAEERLKQQPPQTYLLRGTHQQDMFYLSFIQLDLKISHQYFMMDGGKKEWFYKNSNPHYTTSITYPTNYALSSS